MKLYTAEYDADRPSSKSVEVPLNSTFGVAVGVRWGGEPVRLSEGDVLVDGLSASDSLDGRWLVYKMETDGEPGLEAHEVRSSTDGLVVEDLSVYAEKTYEEAPSSAEFLSVDLAPLAGKVFAKPANVAYSSEDVWSKWPFAVVFENGEGTKQLYASADVVDRATGGHLYRLQAKKSFSNAVYSMQKASGGSWTAVTEFEVPEGSYLATSAGWPSTVRKAYVGAQYVERAVRQFKLYVKKADKGEIEGYGEVVSKAAVNLSGTYADDTEFSYDVPLVEE